MPPRTSAGGQRGESIMTLDIESVLAGHRVAGWREVKPERYLRVCSCGHDLDTRDIEGTHRAHLAAVLREQIGVAQALAWAEGASEGIRTPPHLAYVLRNPYRAAAQVAPSRVPGEES
jgi:hypothetical protein